MLLSEIHDMVDIDSEIDELHIESESIKIPKLFSKYYRILTTEARALEGLKMTHSSLKKELFEYYTGVASDDVYKENKLNRKVLKVDVDMYINADKRMTDIQAKIAQQSMKIKFVEEFIKQINSRNFMIKNFIDFKKFQAGQN